MNDYSIVDEFRVYNELYSDRLRLVFNTDSWKGSTKSTTYQFQFDNKGQCFNIWEEGEKQTTFEYNPRLICNEEYAIQVERNATEEETQLFDTWFDSNFYYFDDEEEGVEDPHKLSYQFILTHKNSNYRVEFRIHRPTDLLGVFYAEYNPLDSKSCYCLWKRLIWMPKEEPFYKDKQYPEMFQYMMTQILNLKQKRMPTKKDTVKPFQEIYDRACIIVRSLIEEFSEK